MSYDIEFFLTKEGEDPLKTVLNIDETDYNIELTQQCHERNIVITSALLAHTPNLEVHKALDCFEIYTSEDDSIGMTISLYNTSGGMSIPYWHADNTSNVLTLMSEYLTIISKHSDYHFFDPQTGELVTAENNFSLSQKDYSRGIKMLKDIMTNDTEKKASPKPATTAQRRTFQRYIAWLPVLILLGVTKYFYYQSRLPETPAVQSSTHRQMPQAPVDETALAAMYALTAKADLSVERSILAGNPRMLTWVVKENGTTVLERNAENEASYLYYRFQHGSTYTIHLKAHLNGAYHTVSNMVTLVP